MSYNLYETFRDLIVTKEDYTEAELFTQQYLNALYPTLDLREGSPLRDIVIRPCATMVALVNKGVVKHFSDNTITGATDLTPTATVDALLSNFFLTRNTGTKTRVIAQLRFSTSLPSSSVSVPVTTSFSVDNVSKFTPIENTTLSLTDGSLQLYSDGAGNQYYFGNVTLEAADSGSASTVDVNQEFLFFTVFDPYFLGASVRSVSQAGLDAETNLEFIARAGDAISTRNLINTPSISTQLNSLFPSVRDLLVSGYGEYEQFRDYRLIPLSTSQTPVPVHVGGFVDIYCKTAIREKTVRIKIGTDGKCLLNFAEPIISVALPASGELAVEYSDGSPVDTLEPNFTLSDINDISVRDLQYFEEYLVPWERETGFSPRQRAEISSAGTAFPADTTFDVKVMYWDSLSSVQSFLDDPASRVVSADYIARGFNVIELLPTIRIVGGAPTDPGERAELTAQIVSAFNRYIDDLGPGQAFVFADALAEVTTSISSYQFNTDMQVSSILYSSRIQDLHYAVSPGTGVIDAPYITNNSSGHDENGTVKVARTFVFYIRPQGVTLL